MALRHFYLGVLLPVIFFLNLAFVSGDSSGSLANETIVRDVCIIGGGSSGTYSAIRLQQLGKSVALIEKEPRLGGHTNTYVDLATNQSFDYGVMTFHNISVVTDYFGHLGVPLAATSFGNSNSIFSNFENGSVVSAATVYSGNSTSAFLAYLEQREKYPSLENGFDLPSPVPDDFLIPWGEFVEKYDLGALAYTAYLWLQGIGNILAQRTLYVLKYMPPSIIETIMNGGSVSTANNDNQELYDKALEELGSSALLSSNVTKIVRGNDSVEVTVSTPSGLITICASKLLIAIQPKLSTLSPFLDLDTEEHSIFGQFNNSYYWNAVIKNSGIPDNTSLYNANPSAPYSIPSLPGIYSIAATTISGLHTVYYSSPESMSDDAVKDDIIATIARLNNAMGFPSPNSTAEFVGFNNHSPFELTTAEYSIYAGFYESLNALQGRRNTWWTGATWHVHDSALLWNFTEYQVLPDLVA